MWRASNQVGLGAPTHFLPPLGKSAQPGLGSGASLAFQVSPQPPALSKMMKCRIDQNMPASRTHYTFPQSLKKKREGGKKEFSLITFSYFR